MPALMVSVVIWLGSLGFSMKLRTRPPESVSTRP
jgi:hypothetical protein